MLGNEAILKNVFLSYSSSDEALAEKIRTKIENANLKVWFAPYDIRKGDQFIQDIRKGLLNSKTAVLLLSQSAIKSFWCNHEWAMRLIQMSESKTYKLIPVLIDINKDQIPLELKVFNFFDFSGTNLNLPGEIHDNINKLVLRIKDKDPYEGRDTIGLPIVILAMKEEEAKELLSKDIFKANNVKVSKEEKANFAKLLNTLKKDHNIADTDIIKYYGSMRNDWNPPIVKKGTIQNALEDVLVKANEDHPRLRDEHPCISPIFLSEDFFSNDDEWRRQTWEYLSKIGCIFIIDAISIFHPMLQEKLKSSELGSNINVSIAVLSPIGNEELAITVIIRAIRAS